LPAQHFIEKIKKVSSNDILQAKKDDDEIKKLTNKLRCTNHLNIVKPFIVFMPRKSG